MRLAQLQLDQQRADAATPPASTPEPDQAADPTAVPLPGGRVAASSQRDDLAGQDRPAPAPAPVRRRTAARRQVLAPDVIGLAAVAAVQAVRSSGLTPVIEQHDTSADEEVGIVLLQEPCPAAELARGSSIELWIGAHERETPAAPSSSTLAPAAPADGSAAPARFDRDRAYVDEPGDPWFAVEMHAPTGGTATLVAPSSPRTAAHPETGALATDEDGCAVVELAAALDRLPDDDDAWFEVATSCAVAPPAELDGPPALEPNEQPDAPPGASARPATAQDQPSASAADADADRRPRPRRRRVRVLVGVGGLVLLIGISAAADPPRRQASTPIADDRTVATRHQRPTHRELVRTLPTDSSQERPADRRAQPDGAPTASQSRPATPAPAAALPPAATRAATPSASTGVAAPPPTPAPAAPSGGTPDGAATEPAPHGATPAQPVRREFFTP